MNSVNRAEPRTISLKIKASKRETNRYLEQQNESEMICAMLMDEIVRWGNNEIYKRLPDGTVVLENCSKWRKKLYASLPALQSSMTFVDFETILRSLYRLANSSTDRGFTPVIYATEHSLALGNNFDMEAIRLHASTGKFPEEYGKGKDLVGVGKCVSNRLREMGFFDRKPFNIDNNPADKESIIHNVVAAIDGWIECDKAAVQAYKNEEAMLAQMRESATLKPHIETFDKFREYCESKDILKWFGRTVQNYFINCLLPAIESTGNPPEKDFILKKKYGKIQQVFYPMPSELAQYAMAHPELGQYEVGDDGSRTYLVERGFKYLDLCISHAGHNPGACFPFHDGLTNGELHRGNCDKIHYGNNYRHYRLEYNGTNVDDQEWTVDIEKKGGSYDGEITKSTTFRMVEGKEVSSLDFYDIPAKTRFQVCLNKVYRRIKKKVCLRHSIKKSYFEGLRIWRCETMAENEKSAGCIYGISFVKRGRRVNAILKQPEIVKRMSSGHPKLELRLSFSVISPQDTFVMTAARMLASAPSYGDAKADEKNKTRFEKCIEEKRKLKVMGIDLGVKYPYAYAISETVPGTGKQDIKKTGIRMVGGNNSEDVQEFINDLVSVRRLLSYARQPDKYDGDDEELFHTITRAQEFFSESLPDENQAYSEANLAAFRSFSVMTEANAVESMLHAVGSCKTEGEKRELKTERSFLPNLLVRYLKKQYGALTESARTETDRIAELYDRNEATRLMLSVLRAWSTLWDKDNRICFDKLTSRLKNSVATMHKQFAAEIVKLALENGVNVIVHEMLNLKRERGDSGKNRMMSIWSPSTLIDCITNAAAWHGIHVAKVLPTCSSQYHYDTQEFGYRSPEEHSLFFLDKNGKPKPDNSDINAAKNIAQWFCDRHTSMPVITLKSSKKKSDKLDSEKEQSDKEGAKIRKGLLTSNFGSPEKGEAYISSLGVKKGDRNIYRHGDTWVTQKQHFEHIERIKSMVGKKAKVAPSDAACSSVAR